MYPLLKPLLFRLDAERAHDLTSAALRLCNRTPGALAVLRRLFAFDDPILGSTCVGLRFHNPVGLAAGFDKRGALIEPMAALGFGYVEVGTVTPRPQPGNPKPRMFRLPAEQALINRLGFNSPGMVAAARNLQEERLLDCVVGINIGKNRDTPLERAAEDYAAAFVALAPLAQYVTINISSPNTPGLRKLHDRAALHELVGAITTINRRMPLPRPVFVKVSPDETPAQLDDVVAVARDAGADGFIAANTTLDRSGIAHPLTSETGGLSGAPLRERARRTIAYLYQATKGSMPIIGVGGIDSAEAAYGHILAGASLVQIYSGMVYRGPGLVGTIKRGLAQRLRQDGYTTLAEAVGQAGTFA